MTNPGTVPVIVGVGIADQRVDEPGGGMDALALMTAAARVAVQDAGGAEIARAIGLVTGPAGSWRYSDAGREIARRLGATSARSIVYEVGIPQQTAFNRAYREVLSGAVDLALVVGGEAAHRSAVAKRAGTTAADTVVDGEPDERHVPASEIVAPPEIAAATYTPFVSYALIECATRAAAGQSPEVHRREVAELWSRFSAVAADNPRAWNRHARSAEWLATASPENRPMASPYNRWQCSEINVDQAAAILICSVAAARRFGVDPARVVYPHVAMESSHAVAIPRRRELHRWQAMEVLGRAAGQHLGCDLSEVPHVEVYSCFPAAVRVQRAALGLPLDGTPTITGGMSFGGGPWNNFVLQATAQMVERLRIHPGDLGMVTTVSGFIHKPGLAVFSTDPPADGLLLDDLAHHAEAATAIAPLTSREQGDATIVSYTVTNGEATGPRVVAIADDRDGHRVVAANSDPGVAAAGLDSDLLGAPIRFAGATFDLT